MYQFFVEDEQVQENKVVILGTDVNHIVNVLRMRTGEQIRVSSASGTSYYCHVSRMSQDEVWAEIDRTDEQGTELPNKVWLFQGIPKSDKLELIIQKTTELGVGVIVPVAMKNCVAKIDDKKVDAKQKRWQAIAESAAKQSKRTVIPQIEKPLPWKQALKRALELDVLLVPYENERGMNATREVLQQIKAGQSVGIMIGPEGGFSEEEIGMIEALQAETAKDTHPHVHKLSLGRRILRTETAGIAALAMLGYETEDR